MQSIYRALAGCAAAAVLAMSFTAPAAAQATDFPSKPVRIVVTFPPGGSADAVVIWVMSPPVY